MGWSAPGRDAHRFRLYRYVNLALISAKNASLRRTNIARCNWPEGWVARKFLLDGGSGAIML